MNTIEKSLHAISQFNILNFAKEENRIKTTKEKADPWYIIKNQKIRLN